MATIKSYTDIEQSKKLAKILPLDSADMHYNNASIKGINYVDEYRAELMDYNTAQKVLSKYLINPMFGVIPCWSLAALLKLIPNFNMFKRTIECKIETTNHSIDKACDLVDAAFEMVCWLKENNEL